MSQSYVPYLVHVYLSCPDDDLPPRGCPAVVTVLIWRSDDPQADEEHACDEALKRLCPYLKNSVNVKTLAVLAT